MSWTERDRIDLARDMIAARIEADFAGWKVSHGIFGWTAERPGQILTQTSHPALASELGRLRDRERGRLRPPHGI